MAETDAERIKELIESFASCEDGNMWNWAEELERLVVPRSVADELAAALEPEQGPWDRHYELGTPSIVKERNLQEDQMRRAGWIDTDRAAAALAKYREATRG